MPDHSVIISPHLDDAVFSCGDLLASRPGSTVVTIFASGPSLFNDVTAWDQYAGFVSGNDIIAARRAEDKAALRILKAEPYWLPFWDSQYGKSPSVKEVKEVLGAALQRLEPSAVFFPLGLFHRDHKIAHDACLSLASRGRISWFMYEDAIYRRYRYHSPNLRLHEIACLGLVPKKHSCFISAASEAKRAAVACYRSQIRALLATPGHPGPNDIYEPEQYWEL